MSMSLTKPGIFTSNIQASEGAADSCGGNDNHEATETRLWLLQKAV